MSIIFKVEDFFNGTKINSYYNKFVYYTKCDSEKINHIQQKKFNMLVKHTYLNIPWYKKRFLDIGYNPKEIVNLNQLKEFPVLTREDLQENMDQMIWKAYKGKIFNGSSSGSSGIPIKYYKDINAKSAGDAAIHTLMGLSGWIPGMSNVHIWGNAETIKQWDRTSSKLKRLIYSRKNIASHLLYDSKSLKKSLKNIIKFKPIVIDGYANSIIELTNYLKKNNLKIPSVKFVFSTAENLEFYYLNQIEKTIAPISDLYGCGEINGVACKPINDDKYYVLDPHVILETMDTINADMKEVLITDLDNFYMPLIRYKVGDLIDDLYPASDKNVYPFSYFKKIFGRTADHILLPDGKKIFPVNLFGGALFRKYSSIKRHKTIWKNEKLIFIFEICGEIDLKELNKDIKRSLLEFNVSFEIKTTDKILAAENGKFKYFEKI